MGRRKDETRPNTVRQWIRPALGEEVCESVLCVQKKDRFWQPILMLVIQGSYKLLQRVLLVLGCDTADTAARCITNIFLTVIILHNFLLNITLSGHSTHTVSAYIYVNFLLNITLSGHSTHTVSAYIYVTRVVWPRPRQEPPAARRPWKPLQIAAERATEAI